MISYGVTHEERIYLRELAKRQMEIAALPIMAQRRRQWTDLNAGRPAIPPVVIETWTFNDDFMPYRQIMKTSSSAAWNIEWQLLGNIRNHELLNDDKVIPPYFEVGWNFGTKPYGLDIPIVQAENPGLAYQYVHPIVDLARDIEKIQPSEIYLDRKASLAWQGFVTDLLGDIMPVVMIGEPGSFSLTHKFIELMGMEPFYLAMYDEPEAVHRLMRFLTDDYIRIARWKEDHGLLTLRKDCEQIITSHLFAEDLPAPGFTGKVRLADSWIWAESQESVGLSPEMFDTFCLPYYAEVCAMMGKIYYGCCEPVHSLHQSLFKAIPNIAKCSISKWCDERIMGEVCRHHKVVYSRKPDPTFVGVGGPVLDEDAWRRHIQTTFEAARGCQVEVIMRDIYSSGGDLNKARRAVEIARDEAQDFLD